MVVVEGADPCCTSGRPPFRGRLKKKRGHFEKCSLVHFKKRTPLGRPVFGDPMRIWSRSPDSYRFPLPPHSPKNLPGGVVNRLFCSGEPLFRCINTNETSAKRNNEVFRGNSKKGPKKWDDGKKNQRKNGS